MYAQVMNRLDGENFVADFNFVRLDNFWIAAPGSHSLRLFPAVLITSFVDSLIALKRRSNTGLNAYVKAQLIYAIDV
jgi:hypothetical protein